MLLALDGRAPKVAASAYIDPTAEVAGNVTIGEDASLWFFVAARADYGESAIVIGPRTNVQDNSILHVEPDRSLTIGADVTVGHGAVLHACTIGDGALIGIGAMVLTGATVGEGAIVAAGSLVPEGAVVPPGMLVMGTPARVRREVSEAERQRVVRGNRNYLELARKYRAARAALGAR
ncbi:MAG TPA: gamma carbonic anhydrase family protein [Thermodesulfobacteriota bacterium]|jgi:carbonic anhydrase/acetyltransferase-like protein (isoleucine patch superfamily)